MKKIYFSLLLLFNFNGFAQTSQNYIEALTMRLDAFAEKHTDFLLPVRTEADLSQLSIADFLQSIAQLNQLNITVDPSLKTRFMLAQLNEVNAKEVLLYLCKQYTLDLAFSESIVHVFPYSPPKEEPQPPFIYYDIANETLSLALKAHSLGEVMEQITRQSPYTLLYQPALNSIPLQFLVENLPFKSALTQLANLHDLKLEEVDEGIFLFSAHEKLNGVKPRKNRHTTKRPFTVLPNRKQLRFHAQDYPIAHLIEALVDSLQLNWYQSDPLQDMGNISLELEAIDFDTVLPLLFDNQKGGKIAAGNTTNQAPYSYRKDGDRYYFGRSESLSARSAAKIVLKHRSVELLDDPYRENTALGQAPSPVISQGLGQSFGQGFGNNFNNQNFNGINQQARFGANTNALNNNTATSRNSSIPKQNLSSLIPEALKAGLQIQLDKELNALLVLGAAPAVARLEDFIKKIDQPVPVILIEVMLIEVNKNAQLDTGISWGLGEEPTPDQGTLFPSVSANIGAQTTNRILGGHQQLRALNLGKLQPNFFLQLRALEESGTVNVLSSPKMATLNGHRAVFSNSEISYYAYTAQNFYGFQNPQTSEITNYIPISAGLTLSVKPYVTGNDDVTLDIFVQQSSFNNVRIAEDAPPGIESREFSSIVRMRNKDIAILGGLEQNSRNDTGTGVPFLARIPILKWFFSQKRYTDSKRKLTVLIQPTIIQ